MTIRFERRAENAQAELTMKTHDLFEIDNWEEFSNKAQTQSGSTNSLEALHDSIHVLIGRNGHFAGPVAGTPLFQVSHPCALIVLFQPSMLYSIFITLKLTDCCHCGILFTINGSQSQTYMKVRA